MSGMSVVCMERAVLALDFKENFAFLILRIPIKSD